MGKILKRTAALVAGLGLAFSVVAATEAPAAAASGCKITYGSYSTVKKGSHGAKARSVECLLHRAGYATSVNGRFSADDAAQLKTFQTKTGLASTGKANHRTWSALIARGTTPALAKGDRTKQVRRLEAALRASGYKVKVNRTFAADTARAVAAIQRAKGWKVTSTATPDVWKALQGGTVVAKLAKATKKSTSTKSTGSGKGKKALAFAKRQLGDRYRYGGTGPSSWDCSGLTKGAWKSAGVSLPRTAAAQFHRGKKISKSNLRPGDLVFFYSGIRHVAIYAGNGKVIHAPQPGKKVSYIKMKYMPYKGARRPA